MIKSKELKLIQNIIRKYWIKIKIIFKITLIFKIINIEIMDNLL